jgi:hypothetical protein
MMPRRTQEDYIRLAAARAGLKLISNRYSIASDKKTYSLRPLWDAKHAVGTLSDGGFGLVKTTTNKKGRRRQTAASWLSLDVIERMLPHWPKADSRNRSRCTQTLPRAHSHLWASIGASSRFGGGATNAQNQ